MQYVKYIVAFIVVVGIVYAGLIALEAFTPEAFALLAAGVLALTFERMPWLKDEFDKLTSEQKQLVMFILLAVLVYGAFGLSCLAVIGAFQCTGAGAFDALVVLFLAIGVNQGIYKLVRKTGTAIEAPKGRG